MALPDRPSLEYLKKLAKDRLPELRRADRARSPGRRAARGGPRARLHQLARAPRRARPATRPCCADPVTELFAAIRARRGGHRGPPARRASGARQRARRGGQHPAVGRGRRGSRRPHPAPAPPRGRSAPGLRSLRPHPAVLGGGDRAPTTAPAPSCGRRRRAGSLLRRRTGRGRPRPRVLRPRRATPTARLRHRQLALCSGRHAPAVSARNGSRGGVRRALHGEPRRSRRHGARAARARARSLLPGLRGRDRAALGVLRGSARGWWPCSSPRARIPRSAIPC